MTSGKTPVTLSLRDVHKPLDAGFELFHAYAEKRLALETNPNSRARFAMPGTRAMYYTAPDLHTSLWEVVMRDMLPDPDGAVYVSRNELAPWRMAHLRLLTSTPYVDLVNSPGNRNLVQDMASRTRLRELCNCDPAGYPDTHQAAAQILASCPSSSVLSWQSAQASTGRCFLFYDPIHSPAALFEVLGTFACDSDEGVEAVRDALAAGGMKLIISSC
jgi:hypothetical protein